MDDEQLRRRAMIETVKRLPRLDRLITAYLRDGNAAPAILEIRDSDPQGE
jgi:hypothetical protein